MSDPTGAPVPEHDPVATPPDPGDSGAEQTASPPTENATDPVGAVVPEVAVTVAVYVTDDPPAAVVGLTETAVVVDVPVTVRVVVPLDGPKVDVPP